MSYYQLYGWEGNDAPTDPNVIKQLAAQGLREMFNKEHNAEVNVFTRLCPLDQNASDFKYEVYVGDWKLIWNKCAPYNTIAYMYSTDMGYKHFCCLPLEKIKLFGNQTQIRRDRIILFNQSQVMQQ